MPKFFKNAEFGRVSYSIIVLAMVCVVAYSFVLPVKKVGAQKFEKKEAPSERLATVTFPTSSALPALVPDSNSAGLTLNYPVSGLTDQLRGVALNIQMNPAHTWLGDLTMTLTSPAPSNSHLILRRVGSTSGTGTGDSSVFGGPYTFTDGTTGDFWTVANGTAFGVPVVSGSYRTLACCAPTTGPGIFTMMNPVFQGPVLTEGVANGTWTLNVVDDFGGDTGTVSATSLTITTLAPTAGFAGIRGGVVTPSGQPIAYARVSILNAETLETRTATTNHFGLFSFEDLPVENFYTMWVEHGRYQFEQQVQSFVLVEDIGDARFVSSPR